MRLREKEITDRDEIEDILRKEKELPPGHG